MKLTLTKDEVLTVLHSAFCDGTSILSYAGISLDYDDKDYSNAKDKLSLKDKNPCREDIWLQILKDGNKIKFIDEENDGEQTVEFNLADATKRLENEKAIPDIIAIINETYDATEAGNILQWIAWNEVIFG